MASLRALMLLSLLIFSASFATGWSWAQETTPAAKESLNWNLEVPFLRIVLVNMAVGALLVCGGFSFGLITALALASNGLTWGIYLARSAGRLGLQQAMLLFVPHGVIELVGLLLLASGGFRIALRMVAHIRNPGSDLAILPWATGWRTILTGGTCILAGALVESFLTLPVAKTLIASNWW